MRYLLLIFLLTYSGIFAQNINGISEVQAEDIYSEALSLSSEGDIDQSIKKLQFLISKNYIDKYIFYSLFDNYLMKISQAQVYEKSDSKKIIEILKEAKKYAGDALKLYPNDIKTLYRYNDFTWSLGQNDEIYNTLQKILSLDKDNIYGNYYLGVYYYSKTDTDKAISYFQKVIANSSDDEMEKKEIYHSYFNLGIIYANQQNYRYAAQLLEKALEKANELNSIEYNLIKSLVITYSTMLEFNKAVENIRLIPEMFISDDMINIYSGILFITTNEGLKSIVEKYQDKTPFVKAIFYYQTGDYSNSLNQLDKYITETRIADFYTHYLLYLNYSALKDNFHTLQQEFLMGNMAKEVEQYDLAINFYRKVENNTNSIPDIYWLIGSLYDDKNDYTNAINYYKKYINYPSDKEYQISAMVRLSYMYYKINDKSKSDSIISEAKKTAKSDRDLYQVFFYSGLMNMEVKRFPNAITDFESALKSEKTDPRLYFFLATSNYELKNRKPAISYLETARNYDKNNPEINNLLAYLYSLENTKLDEALKLINMAIIANPENYAYLDTMGWILYQKSDYKRAFEIFGKVIGLIDKEKLKNGFDEIYYHIGMIYEKMGNQEEADRYFSEGLKINPDNELLKSKVK